MSELEEIGISADGCVIDLGKFMEAVAACEC